MRGTQPDVEPCGAGTAETRSGATSANETRKVMEGDISIGVVEFRMWVNLMTSTQILLNNDEIWFF